MTQMEPDRAWVPPGFGGLPKGWRWRALGESAQIDPRVGKPPSGTRVTVVPMAAVDAVTGAIDAAEVAAVDSVPSHLRRFEEGDVLLAKISPSFQNGKVAVATGLAGSIGFGSSEFHVLRCGEELLAEYLWLVLRRDLVRAHLVPTMSGRAGQQRIGQDALRRLAIPVPPSQEEQARIADAARRADRPLRESLDRAERAAAGCEAVRAAILAEATSSAAPWERRRLDELVPSDRPVRYGIVQPGPERPGGIPYVRVRDFAHGSIALERLAHTSPEIAQRHRRAVLHAGDLLISIRGTVGAVACVPPELDGAHTTQDAARISGLDPVVRDWVALVMRSPQGQGWFRDHTTGRAVQGVNVTALRGMQVPVPPLEEMVRRTGMASRALDHVERAKATIGRATGLLRRTRETVALALVLGHTDVSALQLPPEPESSDVARTTDAPESLDPVPVPADAPAIVHAIGQAGGRLDATTLLANQSEMTADEFYDQLWDAVCEGWLSEPPAGSSLLELSDAS